MAVCKKFLVGNDLLKRLVDVLGIPANTTRFTLNVGADEIVTAECTFEVEDSDKVTEVLRTFELYECRKKSEN